MILTAAETPLFDWKPITTSDFIQILYFVATLWLLVFAIISAIFNKRQIKAAVDGLQQSQEQYEEQNRAEIVVDVQYIKDASCLIVENTGHRVAKDVFITLDESVFSDVLKAEDHFKDYRSVFLAAKRDMLPGKRIVHPLWFRVGETTLRELQKYSLNINIEFTDKGERISREFCIPLKNEFLVNPLPEERIAVALEKLVKKIKS